MSGEKGMEELRVQAALTQIIEQLACQTQQLYDLQEAVRGLSAVLLAEEARRYAGERPGHV